MSLLEQLTDFLWNPWLLAAFLLTGLYFSVKTGFFQLFGLPVWLRATVGSVLRPAGEKREKGISQMQALCTALASTIGTGSIAGVATAICFGGPGAVFWMWVCAIVGMMTSFVEKTLAVRWRCPDGRGGWLGGPMYYISRGMGSRGLAYWYAAACLCAAFVGGNLVQSNAVSGVMQACFGCEPLAVGAVTAVLAGAVMMGGIGRIAAASTVLVPVMGLLYLGSGVLILAMKRELLLPALKLVVTQALCPQAPLGTAAGYTVAAAMRYGVARGVFTNEAGLGTAAIAHASADVDDPARQGMWGILEVGAATLLVCSVTALVILTGGVYIPEQGAIQLQSGAEMTAAAFSAALGRGGGAIVAFSLLLFAFSSILGWSHYGQQCLSFLAGKNRGGRVYRLLFLICILLGSVWEGNRLWVLVDLCNALMAIPNLMALLILSPGCIEACRKWSN